MNHIKCNNQEHHSVQHCHCFCNFSPLPYPYYLTLGLISTMSAFDNVDLSAFSERLYTPDFVKTVHNKPYAAIDPSQPSLSAAGKTVLITGGATGIGFSIARSFAAAGASTIVLLARRAPTLDAASGAIKKEYPETQVLTYPTDITNVNEINKTFDSAIAAATNRSIDVLITSAVYTLNGHSTLEYAEEVKRGSFETNVFGNLELVRKFLSLPFPSGFKKTVLDVSTEGAW